MKKMKKTLKIAFLIIFKSILICLFIFYSNFAEKNEPYSDEELGDISKKTNDYLFVEQKISGKYYFTHGVNIGLGYLALIRRAFPTERGGDYHKGCGLPLFKSFGFVFRIDKIALSKPIICYDLNYFKKIYDYLYLHINLTLGLWCHRNLILNSIEASTINFVPLVGLNWIYKKYVSKKIYRLEGGILLGLNFSFSPTNFVAKNMIEENGLDAAYNNIYNEICNNVNCVSVFADLVIKIPIIRITFTSGKIFEIGWLITNFINYCEPRGGEPGQYASVGPDYDGRRTFQNPLKYKLAHMWQIYFNFDKII